MRISFRAIQASIDDDGEVLSAGLDTGDDWDDEDGHYLAFQRAIGGRAQNRQAWERDGLHVEFDDQIHSGYGVVPECRLRRGMFSVDLSEPLHELDGVEGFDIELAIDQESYEQLRDGLPRVFAGTLARLIVERGRGGTPLDFGSIRSPPRRGLGA